METTHKYTTDGKKVVVIGALNSQEKIVQEIFLIDGCEIPQGEHFVVKSLLDAPAVSWKEKSLKDLEERYDKEKRSWEQEIKRLRDSYGEQKGILLGKSSYIRKAIDKIGRDSFDKVIGFLRGDFKYYVVDEYGIPSIIEAQKEEKLPEYRDGMLRLLTLFGKDDGTMVWGVNKYSDGSGSNKYIYPFSSLKEATEKRNDLMSIYLKERDYHEKAIKTALEYGLPLDSEKLAAFKTKEIEQQKKNAESHKIGVQKCKDKIKEIEAL